VANLTTIALAVFVLIGVATAPPPDLDRIQRLSERIKCPECQVAIADSQAEIAREMRALISERVAMGWSDDQIVAEFRASFGDDVLLDPAFGIETLGLFALPVAALLVGLSLILGRRRGIGAGSR
jgi:cytochrome c-type biogenesis protein CcmH